MKTINKRSKNNFKKFNLSPHGFPLPLQTKCFKCQKTFYIKFVIPRQAYSQKNSWSYWTGQKGKQKICDACLRKLYYDKPTYWTTVKDLRRRQKMRTYIWDGTIAN